MTIYIYIYIYNKNFTQQRDIKCLMYQTFIAESFLIDNIAHMKAVIQDNRQHKPLSSDSSRKIQKLIICNKSNMVNSQSNENRLDLTAGKQKTVT